MLGGEGGRGGIDLPAGVEGGNAEIVSYSRRVLTYKYFGFYRGYGVVSVV